MTKELERCDSGSARNPSYDIFVFVTLFDRLLKFERVFKAQKRIHMSVFKAQRVLDEIHRRYYEETVMILNLMPYRASYPILKLVYSKKPADFS